MNTIGYFTVGTGSRLVLASGALVRRMLAPAANTVYQILLCDVLHHPEVGPDTTLQSPRHYSLLQKGAVYDKVILVYTSRVLRIWAVGGPPLRRVTMVMYP